MSKIYDKALFIQRLKDLMQEHGDTTYTLAKYLHLTPPTISRYLKGDMSPKITALEILSQKYNVNPVWLMGANVSKSLNRPKYETVPIAGVVRAGDSILSEQNIINYIQIPDSMTKGRDVFGLQIIDDSMNNARIYSGDIVIIEKQAEVENGEIAVVLIDGENATVKHFFKTDTTITLVPDSSNSTYKPQVIDMKKTKVKVLGKIVGALIKF